MQNAMRDSGFRQAVHKEQQLAIVQVVVESGVSLRVAHAKSICRILFSSVSGSALTA